MLLRIILNNLLISFLPLAISSTIAILAIEKIRAKRNLILWGNIALFIIVISYSVITCPTPEALQVEWAFYALKEEGIGSYEIHSLLGEGSPSLLGLENEYGKLKGIPVVYSGEHAQMRFKLNRKGYIYIFHFDTSFTAIRQLFPAEEIHRSNPIQSDYWVEIPPRVKTWQFDANPGLEVFLCYVGLKKSDDIKENITNIINAATKSSAQKKAILDSLQNQLIALAPIHFISSGEYEHNLTGVTPSKVKTCICQSQDKESALLLQFVWHK